MLLSKDAFDHIDEDAEVSLTRPTSAVGRPTSAAFRGGRPSSSAGNRSFASNSTSFGGTSDFAPSNDTERGDDLAAPMTAANMRAKMLQQRNRALAKQRQGLQTPTSRVLANEDRPTTGLNVSDVATPMSTRSSGNAFPSLGVTSGVREHGMGWAKSGQPQSGQQHASASSTLSLERQRVSEEEKEGSNIVIPDTQQVSKEDEAKSRSNLTQELIDRGICPVFDPTTADGPGGGGGKLVFDTSSMAPPELRAFLHDPGPRSGGMIQCRIIRDRTGLHKLYPKYRMETDAGMFMMSAQKQKQNKTSNYAISMVEGEAITKDCDGFIGKLRSDFMGLEFVAYSPGRNPSKLTKKEKAEPDNMQRLRQELVAVQYSSSLWGSKPRGPRKMNIVIPRVQSSGERLVCRTMHPDTEGLVALQKSGTTQLIDPYINKSPKWNDQIGAYVLNFNKRVTQASVKNFQLCHTEDPDTVYLQFGRIDKEVFNIDFRFPVSPFQAFAIALSSFDYKLCCE